MDPAHVLLSAALRQVEPLCSWLRKIKGNESFVDNVRTLVKERKEGDSFEEIKFKHSTRRALGLARTWAQQEGLRSPRGRHVVRALFQEESVRELALRALDMANITSGEMDNLFELLEKETE